MLPESTSIYLSALVCTALLSSSACRSGFETLEVDAAPIGIDAPAPVADAAPPQAQRWVVFAGGSFQMGSDTGSARELPVHTVNVPAFELNRTEVTVEQYMQCVTEGECTEPGAFGGCYARDSAFAQYPINCVSWIQAGEYCTWDEGRLPSEAEWEFAARSGGADNTFPWGNEPASCDYLIINEGGNGCGTGAPWPVCSKLAGNTEQGLCDMGGNLWEWVQDRWNNSYNGAPMDGSAWDTGSNNRFLRGGSYVEGAGDARTTNRRVYFGAGYQNSFTGIRCAREPQ